MADQSWISSLKSVARDLLEKLKLSENLTLRYTLNDKEIP